MFIVACRLTVCDVRYQLQQVTVAIALAVAVDFDSLHKLAVASFDIVGGVGMSLLFARSKSDLTFGLDLGFRTGARLPPAFWAPLDEDASGDEEFRPEVKPRITANITTSVLIRRLTSE